MKRTALIVATGALALVACSGDGSPVASTAPVPTLLAAVADAADGAVAAGPMFPSLSGFVAAFVAIGESGAVAQAATFDLRREALTIGPVDAATGPNGFLSLDAIPSGAVGGTYADDDSVTAVFLFLDPRTPTAASAVLSLIGATIASAASFDQAAFITQYTELASDAANRTGEQRWLASENGSGHSIVTTIVAGDTPEANLVEVAIVPYADEAAAKAAVKPIRNAVFALADVG
jgi:hypothetical protein